MKDIKFEKANHEATPKHQGNLQRFLRELHKGHEREERDKQKAKDEVDRLNGVVSRLKTGSQHGERTSAMPQPNVAARQATPAERKKQLQQLAEMGVAVPEDFRREMAMAGDWQTTSQRVLYDTTQMDGGIKKEEVFEDSKNEILNVGVRKRKYEGEEEEEEAGEKLGRRGWGSTTRSYPGSTGHDDDLDALLKRTTNSTSASQLDATSSTALTGIALLGHGSVEAGAPNATTDSSKIKQEQPATTAGNTSGIANPSSEDVPQIKHEEDIPGLGIAFKKRKPKATQSR